MIFYLIAALLCFDSYGAIVYRGNGHTYNAYAKFGSAQGHLQRIKLPDGLRVVDINYGSGATNTTVIACDENGRPTFLTYSKTGSLLARSQLADENIVIHPEAHVLWQDYKFFVPLYKKLDLQLSGIGECYLYKFNYDLTIDTTFATNGCCTLTGDIIPVCVTESENTYYIGGSFVTDANLSFRQYCYFVFTVNATGTVARRYVEQILDISERSLKKLLVSTVNNQTVVVAIKNDNKLTYFKLDLTNDPYGVIVFPIEQAQQQVEVVAEGNYYGLAWADNDHEFFYMTSWDRGDTSTASVFARATVQSDNNVQNFQVLAEEPIRIPAALASYVDTIALPSISVTGSHLFLGGYYTRVGSARQYPIIMAYDITDPAHPVAGFDIFPKGYVRWQESIFKATDIVKSAFTFTRYNPYSIVCGIGQHVLHFAGNSVQQGGWTDLSEHLRYWRDQGVNIDFVDQAQ